MIEIDLSALYGDIAKIDRLEDYEQRALALAGEGNEVVLTGAAPVWLYLRIAHALHGKARRLLYRAPALQGRDLVIFDHSPY